MDGQRIVDLARAYIGTPWRHQGRSRAGLDCVGLLYRVWCDLGLDPSVDGTGYGHVSDGKWLRGTVERLLRRVPSPRPGGVVLMAQKGMHPLHVGIVSASRAEGPQRVAGGPPAASARERASAPKDDRFFEVGSIIHANARARGVVEQAFVPALGLRPVAYFEFPDGEERGLRGVGCIERIARKCTCRAGERGAFRAALSMHPTRSSRAPLSSMDVS